MSRTRLKDVVRQQKSSLKLSDLKKHGAFPVFGASGLVGYRDFFQSEKEAVAIIKDGAGIGRVSMLPKHSSVLGTMQMLEPKEGISNSYLFYYLSHLKLGKSFTGSTIPHIYFKNYSDSSFPDVSYNQQCQVAEKLDAIRKSIEQKSNQLSILDSLVKSRFMEMFGDVLRNTKGFQMCHFGEYVYQMNIGPFGSDLKNDCFVSKEQSACMVYEQKHAIDKTLNVPTRYINNEKYAHLKRFEIGPGDIIVSCRGTIGKCWLLPDEAPKGIIHPSLMLIKPNDAVNHEFLVYLLERILSEQTQQGSGVKMAIKAKDLSKIVCIKPEREEQDYFIDFVHLVDKSRFVVQKEIKDLQELLDSKMDEYFGGEE